MKSNSNIIDSKENNNQQNSVQQQTNDYLSNDIDNQTPIQLQQKQYQQSSNDNKNIQSSQNILTLVTETDQLYQQNQQTDRNQIQFDTQTDDINKLKQDYIKNPPKFTIGNNFNIKNIQEESSYKTPHIVYTDQSNNIDNEQENKDTYIIKDDQFVFDRSYNNSFQNQISKNSLNNINNNIATTTPKKNNNEQSFSEQKNTTISNQNNYNNKNNNVEVNKYDNEIYKNKTKNDIISDNQIKSNTKENLDEDNNEDRIQSDDLKINQINSNTNKIYFDRLQQDTNRNLNINIIDNQNQEEENEQQQNSKLKITYSEGKTPRLQHSAKQQHNKKPFFSKQPTKLKFLNKLFTKQQSVVINKRYENLTTMTKVIKFVRSMKIQGGIWSPKLLQKNIYDIIDDKAYYEEGQKLKKRLQLINLKGHWYHKNKQNAQDLKNYMFSFPVMNPGNNILIIWDIIHVFCILFCLFFILIQLFVKQDIRDKYSIEFKTLIFTCISVFSLNILLNFNVGYYSEGQLYMNRRDIFKRYIKIHIWLDFLALLPLFESLYPFPGLLWILDILILWKVQAISSILNKYTEILIIKQNVIIPAIIKLLRLFFYVILIAHFLACCFLGLHYLQEHNQKSVTWVTKYDSSETDYFVLYNYSLYFTVMTMTSVGYGDITPSNKDEILFLTFQMFIACFTFAYSFNAIGLIVQDINKQERYFIEEMRLVNRYFQENKIAKSLQIKVRKYIDYKHQADTQLTLDQKETVLKKVSQDLKLALLRDANYQYFETIPYFIQTFSQPFLSKLTQYMETRLYLKGQEIYQTTEFSQEEENFSNQLFDENPKKTVLQQDYCQNLYFIKSGSVDIFYCRENDTENQIKVKNLQKSSHFGEIGFITGIKRLQTAVSTCSSQILILKKREFMKLILEFQEDYQKFCDLRDQIIHSQNIEDFESGCYACIKGNHECTHCPKVHYLADIEKVILKSNQQIDQIERRLADRDQLKKDHAWSILQELSDAQYDFLIDLNQEEYEEYILQYIKEEDEDQYQYSITDQEETNTMLINPSTNNSQNFKRNQDKQKSYLTQIQSPLKKNNIQNYKTFKSILKSTDTNIQNNKMGDIESLAFQINQQQQPSQNQQDSTNQSFLSFMKHLKKSKVQNNPPKNVNNLSKRRASTVQLEPFTNQLQVQNNNNLQEDEYLSSGRGSYSYKQLPQSQKKNLFLDMKSITQQQPQKKRLSYRPNQDNILHEIKTNETGVTDTDDNLENNDQKQLQLLQNLQKQLSQNQKLQILQQNQLSQDQKQNFLQTDNIKLTQVKQKGSFIESCNMNQSQNSQSNQQQQQKRQTLKKIINNNSQLKSYQKIHTQHDFYKKKTMAEQNQKQNSIQKNNNQIEKFNTIDIDKVKLQGFKYYRVKNNLQNILYVDLLNPVKCINRNKKYHLFFRPYLFKQLPSSQKILNKNIKNDVKSINQSQDYQQASAIVQDSIIQKNQRRQTKLNNRNKQSTILQRQPAHFYNDQQSQISEQVISYNSRRQSRMQKKSKYMQNQNQTNDINVNKIQMIFSDQQQKIQEQQNEDNIQNFINKSKQNNDINQFINPGQIENENSQ